MIEASDGSLYTGITNDLAKRFQAHSSGKGARFFAGRTPRQIRYTETHPDRSAASKREAVIKKMKRIEKLTLISQWTDRPDPLSVLPADWPAPQTQAKESALHNNS